MVSPDKNMTPEALGKKGGLSQKPDAGNKPLNAPSPSDVDGCQNVEKCPAPGTCCY